MSNRLEKYLVIKKGLNIHKNVEGEVGVVWPDESPVPVNSIVFLKPYAFEPGLTYRKHEPFDYYYVGSVIEPNRIQYSGELSNFVHDPSYNPYRKKRESKLIDPQYFKKCSEVITPVEKYLCHPVRAFNINKRHVDNKESLIKYFIQKYPEIQSDWTSMQIEEYILNKEDLLEVKKEYEANPNKYLPIEEEIDRKQIFSNALSSFIDNQGYINDEGKKCICIESNKQCRMPFWTKRTVNYFKENGMPNINSMGDLFELIKDPDNFEDFIKDRKEICKK